MDLTAHALQLLEDPDYLADASEGVGVGNTVVGSVMSLTLGAPRWATERAVAEALAQIDVAAKEDDDEE